MVGFPVRAHAWVVGQVSSRGRMIGNHTLVFPSFSPSLPLSLKINKIFFKKGYTEEVILRKLYIQRYKGIKGTFRQLYIIDVYRREEWRREQ